MHTTVEPALEKLTIELPASVVSALRAKAEAKGRDISRIAAESLVNLYAVGTSEPPAPAPLGDQEEIYAALHGPAHRFDPEALHKSACEKYGTPNLSHLSKEELAEQAEETVSRMEPSRRAEMARLGLL